MKKKGLGSAGEKAIIEDFQSGEELSIFIITNGEDYEILPVARDYKRLCDGQKGPNTGGMGAIAPIRIPANLKKNIEDFIIKPTLEGLKADGMPYSGVLYIGLMVHKGIPKVLEYNVRFGDPEAQALLPLLDGSWANVFYKIASNQKVNLKWKDKHTVCIVLASEGYPDHPVKGTVIDGFIYYKSSSSYFLHGALTQRDKDQKWVVNGGRVLNIVSIGDSRQEAIAKAYDHLKKISWEGLQYRKDIGT